MEFYIISNQPNLQEQGYSYVYWFKSRFSVNIQVVQYVSDPLYMVVLSLP
jgi:hypothetical protein